MIIFFTQRAQRFITFRVSRLRWSGRKLRYDKSAQRVLSTPSASLVRPVSGGQLAVAVSPVVTDSTPEAGVVPRRGEGVDGFTYPFIKAEGVDC